MQTTIQKHADKSLSFIDNESGEYIIDTEQKFDDFFTGTTQEVSNRLIEFAIQEFPKYTEPSLNEEDERCLYKKFDDKGNVINACIIGKMLPMEFYNKSLEYSTIVKLFLKLSKDQFITDKNDDYTHVETVLSKLQEIHDNSDAVDMSKPDWFYMPLKYILEYFYMNGE